MRFSHISLENWRNFEHVDVPVDLPILKWGTREAGGRHRRFPATDGSRPSRRRNCHLPDPTDGSRSTIFA